MRAIQAALPEELTTIDGVDPSSARRIVSLVYRGGTVPDSVLDKLPERAPATIRRRALDAVRAVYEIPSLVQVERVASAIDPFVKYAFARSEGDPAFETVRIPLERAGRFSVCVSSQVGCALACAFCSTGRMGLQRNLEAWEIVEQVRRVRSELPEGGRVHGVVFQGMGEPLANVDAVIRAIAVFSEPSALAVDRRNITVCTSGLPSGIRALTRAHPDVRIGLSIGDVRPDKRVSLMPIEKTHAFDDVLDAVGAHVLASGHSPMWAYTLLAGVNDDADAARALAGRARAFAERFGHRPRLSLIPFNAGTDLPFERSSDEVLAAFRHVLSAEGQGSIVRYSGGSDVAAACGQLARADATTPGRGIGRFPRRAPSTVESANEG